MNYEALCERCSHRYNQHVTPGVSCCEGNCLCPGFVVPAQLAPFSSETFIQPPDTITTDAQKAEVFDWLATNWREAGVSNMAEGSIAYLLHRYSIWPTNQMDFPTAIARIRKDILDEQLTHFDRWVERYSE